jgi:DNA-binding transcriptional MerR regulator
VPRSANAAYTAAETARQLGVSVRALRVYERQGLVRPVRTAAGWRLYGPEQLSRLHQVLALKRVGMKLAQIADLIRGHSIPLDRLLALQEEELLRRKRSAERALSLVRNARQRIAKGETFALNDLISLIRETGMTDSQLNAEFKSLWSRYIDADQLKARHPDWLERRFGTRWLGLIAESERLKDSYPGAPAALDLARRGLSLVAEVTQYDPELMATIEKIWQEGCADPKIAPHMPQSEKARQFMDAAVKRLRELEQEQRE